MRIGVIGGGVVGRATAAAFTGYCEDVRVYDIDANLSNSSEANVYHYSDVVFVCIPEHAVQSFFNTLPDWARSKNFVLRSTVPVGTTRYCAEKFNLPSIVHSPEFLTERTALEDAANPRLLILGHATHKHPTNLPVFDLYRDRWPEVETWTMAAESSELVKLATNAFFATKVSFWNEVESYCRAAGIDYETVRAACVAEGRVGDLHTHVPGPDGKRGFGGKCLPKDLTQLINCLWDSGTPAPVMDAVRSRNTLFDRKE